MFRNLIHHLFSVFIYLLIFFVSLIAYKVFDVPEKAKIYDLVIVVYTSVLAVVSYLLFRYLNKFLNKDKFKSGTFVIAVSIFAGALGVMITTGIIDFSLTGITVWVPVYFGFASIAASSLMKAFIYKGVYKNHLSDMGFFKGWWGNKV